MQIFTFSVIFAFFATLFWMAASPIRIESSWKVSGNRLSCSSVVYLQPKVPTYILGKPPKPVPFHWFVKQWRCQFEPTTSWQACTRKNWFLLAAGSPWQFRSLTPHYPLIDLLGFGVLFPSIFLISTRILSDQLMCPGTWIHWGCSSCFLFTLIFQQLALSRLMWLWYSPAVFTIENHTQ